MKTILVAVLGLFLFCAVAKADECISVDSFVTEFAKEGISFHGSNAAATEKLARVFNENRAASGSPEVKVSIFLFGPMKNNAGEVVVVAAAADSAGCVMPKTVVILTLRQFSEFTSRAGISPKDLILMYGA